ncbi:SMP-30/gluconolactonase/LRE family protein [Marinicellulosiphila megalodicopiae]|uniref:SMP-30/gluconolactonase/LRE family protein n=1 Tax=Marinicellulosiphila megalodicopiae TaxID=2724896 RepID=UPI003BAE8511
MNKLEVISIETLPVDPCSLGEGPTWHEPEQSFYWVDILKNRLHNWHPIKQTHRSWTFEKMIGCVGVCESGKLIIALSNEIIFFEPDLGMPSRKQLCLLDEDIPANRANDGKIDPWGRLFVGTMSTIDGKATGRLSCIDSNGHKITIEENIGISNTLAWSADKTKFYFADSTKQTIWEYPLDTNGLPIAKQKKVFIQTEIESGAPDGSSIDNHDNLWNAQWNNARVQCFNPQGDLIDELHLPASLTTSVCFGGDDYQTMYITTASIGLSEQDLNDKPESGKVFLVKTNIKGPQINVFKD